MTVLESGDSRGQDSRFAIELPANSTRKFILTSEEPLAAGYLELSGAGESVPGDLAVSFFYIYVVNGRLVDSVGVPAIEGRTNFQLPIR